MTAPRQHIVDPTIREATTALMTVEFVMKLGLQKVELENDVLWVLQIPRKEEND